MVLPMLLEQRHEQICYLIGALLTISLLEFEQALPTDKPTRVRNNHNKEDTEKAKIVFVKDNFIIILAAIAGALGTAIIVIPIALFCRRTSRR